MIKDIIEDEDIQKYLMALPPVSKRLRTHANLPNPFVPATNSHYNEIFYWDSYFIMCGLAVNPKNQPIIKGIIENMFVLLKHYGYIPNSYDSYDTRTQPPFLSSMVCLVENPDKKWLKQAYRMVVFEYQHVWTSGVRQTKGGFSRYHDWRFKYKYSSEKTYEDSGMGKEYGAIQESGWDMTRRFDGRTDFICPVDLNSLLYKYEVDLERWATDLGLSEEAKYWKSRAKKRKDNIRKVMWNPKEGLFFDLDYETNKLLGSRSLATFFPLWAGIASKEEAESVCKKSRKWFEFDYGLATTEKRYGGEGYQWGYPNGWAPLHLIAIRGLRRYGLHDDANRLTYKWLKLCAKIFVENHEWGEKLSVVKGVGRRDDLRYDHQKFTYWNLGVFEALYKDALEHAKDVGILDYVPEFYEVYESPKSI